MIARLKEMTGLDPITIDQTGCRLLEGDWTSGATVDFEPGGAAAVEGHPPGTFDLQIRYVSETYEPASRASWLGRLGRKPIDAPQALRSTQEAAVIIEARPAGEPADAAPFDRLYLGPGESLPLMLAPDDYAIATVGGADTVEITVE